MAPLPQIKTATAIAIEAAYEAKRTPRHGYRLPPSRLGTECERALWYSFRWCTPPAVFDGRLLRLFETGDSQEARMVADLRLIGCDVLDCDPDDDTKQIGISFAYGHGYGFLDAEVLGLPDAPMTVHVAEMKTHNQKSFDALQRHGVEKSKPEHYAQTMIYMHKRARDRGLYMAVNKNTDELYFERIEYDIAKAVRLERKAERIVFASVPADRDQYRSGLLRVPFLRSPRPLFRRHTARKELSDMRFRDARRRREMGLRSRRAQSRTRPRGTGSRMRRSYLHSVDRAGCADRRRPRRSAGHLRASGRADISQPKRSSRG